MNKEVKKNMTIDELALLMQGEFVGVKEEFAGVNQRLDALEVDVKFIKDNAKRIIHKT